jgi:quercetin dioxygenase-like cupin family protein
MIARRDFVVATVSILATVAVVTFAQTAAKPMMRSSVFNWSDMKVENIKVGERRAVFDTPTANLTKFECHITTLNPGEMPHAAHRHGHEEMMIVKEGTLEVVQNGVTNRVDAGGIIFEGSNELHGLRNIGTNRATYFVLAWYPHDLVETPAK